MGKKIYVPFTVRDLLDHNLVTISNCVFRDDTCTNTATGDVVEIAWKEVMNKPDMYDVVYISAFSEENVLRIYVRYMSEKEIKDGDSND